MCTKKERCPYCLGTNLRPKGWSGNKLGKRKRCMKCGDCKKHITKGGKAWFVSDEQKNLIDKLLLERLSLRGICRVVGISLSWLLRYVKSLYDLQPNNLNYQIPKEGDVYLKLIDSEVDEM